VPVCAFLTLGAVASLRAQTAHEADTLSYRPNDPLNLTAFIISTILITIAPCRSSIRFCRRHPDDPFAVNHLLTAVLFRELYRMGALNTGELCQ